MSKRGDIDGVVESLKGYWKDKRAHPWHRIYKIIDSNLEKEKKSEVIILIRDAVFSAMDGLSMSLPLEISTEEVLRVICSAENWRQGKRKARNECAEKVEDLLAKDRTDFFVESALRRDGFGYLVSQLHKARLSRFRKGKPKVEKGKIQLKKLRWSSIGRRLLKEQMISEEVLDAKDPRAEQLQDVYENLLLELEIDVESHIPIIETEQITLNGRPIEEELVIKQTERSREEAAGVQADLTEFIGVKVKDKKSSKRKARDRAKRKREKKRKQKGGSKND